MSGWRQSELLLKIESSRLFQKTIILLGKKLQLGKKPRTLLKKVGSDFLFLSPIVSGQKTSCECNDRKANDRHSKLKIHGNEM
uniref:Uncharacterized protein n=1 Tax=Pristionchus pacificus TaxID=54126 RepID=A0A2A6C1E3_PRIPA|eukprot:PDM72072.1 hypothetical protein PRIPAC_38479 [Pristionchus pacificus]